MRRLATAWIAALVFLAACGEKSPTPSAQDSPTPSPTATASPSPTECRRATRGEDSHVLLTAVDISTETNADRVTFEFKTTSMGTVMPRYELDAARLPITEDPTGNPIEVEGDSFAQVVFHGASGTDTDRDPAVKTYTGPKELKPGFEVLREAEQTGDFEFTLGWVFGLSRASCWKVTDGTDPLRLTIEFPH